MPRYHASHNFLISKAATFPGLRVTCEQERKSRIKCERAPLDDSDLHLRRHAVLKPVIRHLGRNIILHFTEAECSHLQETAGVSKLEVTPPLSLGWVLLGRQHSCLWRTANVSY